MQETTPEETHTSLLPTTPFIGRRSELVELADRLQNPDCRLLTLLGPGGIGKTRLALEVTGQQRRLFSDGVYFVALEALSTPDFIVGAIAEAAGYRIHEAGDSKRQLLNFLRHQNALLLLDNFEHLLDGVGMVGDILTAAPRIKILVTSREVLNLHEEWVWPVTGMDYPSVAELDGSSHLNEEEYSAIQLFVQNARRIRNDFSFEDERGGVLQLCALVEGMPLALELAATWVRVLSCEEIASEIARNLDFLKTRVRNVSPRHRSMRAVLDQSWRLLTEEQQIVFRRLSVFRGGFTREAAAQVAEAALPVLTALLDKSLLRLMATGRYNLHELVRQYAERQLKDLPDDFERTREHHSAYFMDFLRQQWPLLLGGQPKEALCAIEVEIDNIRTAWGWAVMQGMTAEIDRGLDSLWFFYDTRSWYREGEKVLALAAESLATTSPETNGSLLLGRVLARQGVLCNNIQQRDDARSLLETALAIFRRLNARAEIAFALARLGEAVVYKMAFAQAQELFETSLTIYEEIGDRWGQAFVLNWLGSLSADRRTRFERHERSLIIYQEINSQWGIAVVTPIVGFSSLTLGNYHEAMRLGQEGLALCQTIGIRWGVAMSMQVLGVSAYQLENYHAAVQYFVQSLQEALELRLERFLMYSAYGLARVLDALGHPDQAAVCDTVAYHYSMLLLDETRFINFEELAPERMAIVTERSKTVDPEVEFEHLLAELLPITSTLVAAHAAEQPLISPLTGRELEILARVSSGMSNRDIAKELFLSTGTVKWYLSQMYRKLGVNSRTQAVARARDLQLLS